MIASSITVSCNFSSLPLKPHVSLPKSSLSPSESSVVLSHSPRFSKISFSFIKHKEGRLQICGSSLEREDIDIASSDEETEVQVRESGGGGEERDWTTSILLFAFWAGLMYYVFLLAPDQTPVTDSYFLKKLLNLGEDDGFKMNQVLVAVWYIMGLWPLLYGMLLLPTARSSKTKIPVWPFVFLSCFGGAYALVPYFVLWRPPAPPVEESELRKWPLNFLESKLTAGITMAAGLAVMIYAFSAGGDVWKEFYQYFKGSKFIHIMSIDFALLSTFAPFWVYNDMTTRKWFDKGYWLLPLSLIPFLGPALYLLLRPSISADPMALAPSSDET